MKKPKLSVLDAVKILETISKEKQYRHYNLSIIQFDWSEEPNLCSAILGNTKSKISYKVNINENKKLDINTCDFPKNSITKLEDVTDVTDLAKYNKFSHIIFNDNKITCDSKP